MKNAPNSRESGELESPGARPDSVGREPTRPANKFTKPRLRFWAPTVTSRGDMLNVTAGFFGSFSP